MTYSAQVLGKLNEFADAERGALLAAAEYDRLYPMWRESVEEEDDIRLEDALASAPRNSWVVARNWSHGGKTLRKGSVVHVHDTRDLLGHLLVCMEESHMSRAFTCHAGELEAHAARAAGPTRH